MEAIFVIISLCCFVYGTAIALAQFRVVIDEDFRFFSRVSPMPRVSTYEHHHKRSIAAGDVDCALCEIMILSSACQFGKEKPILVISSIFG